MFYERFKNLCEINNTTPTAVLKELNISTSKGTAWKNGSEPNGKYIILISDYFKVSTDYLLGKEEKEKNHIINNKNTINGGIQANNYKLYERDGTLKDIEETYNKLPFEAKIELLQNIKQLKDKYIK